MIFQLLTFINWLKEIDSEVIIFSLKEWVPSKMFHLEMGFFFSAGIKGVAYTGYKVPLVPLNKSMAPVVRPTSTLY